MALKGLLATVAVLVVFMAFVSHAAEQQEEEKGEEDARVFQTDITDTSNQSVVVANAGMVLIGLVVLSILVVLLATAFLGRGRDAPDYTVPSSYSSGPSHAESSYAVHRSLEEGAKKFQ